MTKRRSVIAATFLVALLCSTLCSTSLALAQTVSGSIPRAESPQTWQRPDGGCSGITPVNPTTRRFNLAKFTLNGPGNYTLTATRSDGGFIALDAYGSFFAGATPGYECSNRDNYGAPSGMGSVSDTLSCSGSICSSGGFVTEVVISVGATDSVPITFTVSGGPAVTFSCGTDNTGFFTPNSQSITSAGGSFSTAYSPGSSLGCSPSWTSSGVPSWISGFPGSGTGAQTINYTAASNSTGSTRSASIWIGSASLSLSQPSAPLCSYAFASPSGSISAAGGTQSVNMNTTSGCAWTASTSTSWLSGVTSSGTGTGAVSYTAAANTGPARSGTITSQGQTFTVNQPDGCAISLTPSTASVSAAGGTGFTASLSTGAGCAWTLGSSSGFLSGFAASGTGPATISYDVAANTSVARSATLTASLTGSGATDTLVVSQADGCTASVSPTTINTDGSAHTENVTLTLSNAACSFTTSTTGGFITPSPSSGSGSQTIGLALSANTGVARSGSATIAGQTVSVNQASGCTISVSPSSVSVGAGAGNGSVDVAAPLGCAWTLASSAGFVSGFSASGSGSATVPYSIAANPGLARSATLTASLIATGASDTHVVNQSQGCSANVSPTAITADGSAHGETVSVTMSDPACPFTASSGDTWIVPTPTSGTGTTSVSLALAANSGAARSGSATVAGQTVTVDQASVCTISVDPTANVGAAAGTGSFALTTQAGCAWSIASSAGFVSGFATSGTGSATITYGYAQNVSIGRSATLTATLTATSMTATHMVNQASGCTASLSANSATPAASAGSDSVDITVSDAACPWGAASDSSWLTLPTTSGTGNATLTFDYQANVGPARTGKLTILGQTLDVTQASGCVVSVAASQNVTFAGGSGTVDVTTATGCTWTASTATAWLSNVTASGTGPGTINFDFSGNVGPARTGTISVASSMTASTASHSVVQGNGCVAMLSSAAASLGAGATSGSVMLVLSDASCMWSASSSAAWLAVDSGSLAGMGSATIGFAVANNMSVARSATLTIAGQTFDVAQASGCAIALTPTSGSASAAGDTLSFDVATDVACAWTAASSLSWVSGLTASGTGPATIALSAAANVGPARSGDVGVTATDTALTANYQVSQADGCVATLASDTLSVDATGKSGSVGVTFSSQSCPWNVTADAFISVTNSSGTGDATIAFAVGPNVGPARTGTITVLGKTFTVTQTNGCAVVLTPDAESKGPASGKTQVKVQTEAGCTWTASTAADWITGFADSGTGADTLDVNFSANTGPTRTGKIKISASSGTVTSYALTQGDGCVLTLPVDAAEVPADGGSSSFAVMHGQGCDYSVTSDASWVHAMVSDTGVKYDVDPWDGAARSAQITVKSTTTDSSATFTLGQRDGCALMLTPGDVRVAAQGIKLTVETKTGKGCSVKATTDSDFLSGIAVDGTTVDIVVAKNDGAERKGIVVVTTGDSMGEFVVVQDAAAPVGPDGGVNYAGDGGASDGGVNDGGFKYQDLKVGGGCSCSLTGRDRSLEHGFFALFFGLVFGLRLWRRHVRRVE